MNDPFSILGISSSASEEEIKKAYRQKCKQYHPDLNPNDPTAEEKFKQVQTAYSDIMKIKQGGSTGASYAGSAYRPGGSTQYQYQEDDSDPFGGFGGFGFGFDPFGFGFGEQQYTSRQPESPELQAAGNYVRNARYREAMNTLNGIPEAERTARWYYYASLASNGLGNGIDALNFAKRAVAMEPNNFEYQNLLKRLNGSSQSYQNYQNYQNSNFRTHSVNMNNWCWYMILLNCLCNCCCNGRGFY